MKLTGKTAREIAASAERSIREGELLPGSQLPTVRELAESLEVSPMTVASAYRVLRQRGLVTTAGRRGTRVNERPPLPVAAAPFVPAGARDLATGNPDPALLPSISHVLARLDCGARSRPPTNKLPALAERAEAAFASDGIEVSSIAVVGGALDAVERILAAHLVPGDVVAVEDPTFSRVLDLLRALGLRPTPIAVDDDGPRPDSLLEAIRGGAKAFIVTPRWQNPFGARLSAERASALRRVLEQHEDVLLVEDDHAGLIAPEPCQSLAGSTYAWATIRSASKALGADYRLAVLTGDETTVARVEGRQLLGTGWVSLLLQEIVAELWGDPATQAAVSAAAAAYDRRRRALIEALAQHGIDSHGASGLNVWIPVTEEASAVAGLLQRGWAVMAGERFRLSPGPAIRITIATLSEEEADLVASDLAEILSRRAGAFAS